MHIPDGYLGPSTYGTLWAVMIGLWSYGLRKIKDASQMPFLAMASAFSFVVMIFTIPLPGGTTAHITGATLIAVLIGPWPAVIAVSVALVIQSLLFGDGGITAIGANCFNMAFMGTLTGYAVYSFILKLGKSPSLHVLGTAIGSYAGVNASALFTAIELGIQPFIYGKSTVAYFPYSLEITIPAIMIPHLTLVGAIEGLVASLVIVFLRKVSSETISILKGVVLILPFALHILYPLPSSAHDFWIEQRGDNFRVVFGHGTHREEFEPSKIKSIRVIDTEGRDIPFKKEMKDKGLNIRPERLPALIIVEIDNGYWSKTIYGWKELPKRKASRVVEALRSIFYTKTIISWSEAIEKASSLARLDILPLKNPFEIQEGETLPLKILLEGKPLAGAEVFGIDHKKIGTTSRDGLISIPIFRGNNLVTVNYREPLKDDPDADVLSLTATLTFEVKR